MKYSLALTLMLLSACSDTQHSISKEAFDHALKICESQGGLKEVYYDSSYFPNSGVVEKTTKFKCGNNSIVEYLYYRGAR